MYALHRAVIQRNLQDVEKILDSGADINERDGAGIPALHYAVHLCYADVVSYLLKRGADVSRKSAAGWSALQEAIAVRSKILVRDILRALQRKVNTEYEKRIPILLDILQKMPDFYMELKWELHSWVPLVSILCPSDNYKIYKRGANLRIDTTLAGFDNMRWTRGDISIVFKGEEDGGILYVLDHKHQTMEKTVIGDSFEADIADKEVNEVLSSTSLIKMSPIFDHVVFATTKTWFGNEKTEKIGDDAWNAKIYEVSGFDLKILNRHRVKRTDAIPKTKEDRIKDLLERSGTPSTKFTGLLLDNEAVSEKLKSYKATVWISEEFPRTKQELLPIFEILAPTQKHFHKLNTFISLKMPSAGFPVKVDIPVFPTISGTATFTHHELKQVDTKYFVIPPYTLKNNKQQKSSDKSTSKEKTPLIAKENHATEPTKTLPEEDEEEEEDSHDEGASESASS